jgi:hypothetical protein
MARADACHSTPRLVAPSRTSEINTHTFDILEHDIEAALVYIDDPVITECLEGLLATIDDISRQMVADYEALYIDYDAVILQRDLVDDIAYGTWTPDTAAEFVARFTVLAGR